MTLRQLLEWGTEFLKKCQIVDASVDAWYLLEYAFGINRVDYLIHPDVAADETQSQCYRRMIEERAGKKPLQYITGTQNFMGLEFTVNENVLIPRLDTEVLVETVLSAMPKDASILDMCTGSGCILISLMALGNAKRGVGVDLSQAALHVAQTNADRLLDTHLRETHRVDQTFELIQSDLFENVHEKFDVIVSNPPYIPTDEIPGLMEEVGHEPYMALDGHGDGLYFYRKIIEQAGDYLMPEGMLFFEIGWNQADDVCRMLEKNGFGQVHVKKDLAGLDRIVYAVK